MAFAASASARTRPRGDHRPLQHYIAAHHPIEWQPNFFDHRLRTAAELEEKSNYIAMNPVRRALCEKPEDWPWTFRPKQNASI